MPITEANFKNSLRNVFRAAGCPDDAEKVTKRQCFTFVKMVAMPQLQQAEPTDASSPGKTAIINVAKARAEKKRREEELEAEIAQGFDEHFAELLEYEHD